MLQRFAGGPPDAVRKLNAIVDELNSLANLRGDEKFITVRRGTGGGIITFNLKAILASIPKLVAGRGGQLLTVNTIHENYLL